MMTLADVKITDTGEARLATERWAECAMRFWRQSRSRRAERARADRDPLKTTNGKD